MNIKHNILYGTLLLLAGCCMMQSCREDMPDIYDREQLISQGRYLTARAIDTYALDINSDPRPFDAGTPYRLIAFTKPYKADKYSEQTPVADDPRFNMVAWEGSTENDLRFINIDSDPSKWFGFTSMDASEESGDDGLVSLDFYGLTYGVPQDRTPNYIPVDGWQDEATVLSDLTHTETIPEGGTLNDLMRGVLLNQNISTAGIESINADGTQNHTLNTQSVIQFRHCFSKVHFQVSQQPKENEKDADGNPVPSFNNLVVEKIEVTNTYQTGIVSLADGKVNVSGNIDRTLEFDEDFTGQVTLKNNDAGEMILFPSHNNALSNKELSDGYTVGLKISLKSTEKKDIENMLANTGSTGGVTEETDDKGVKWYKGTVVKNEITDYYTDPAATDRTLYLKQNTSYMLIITFQKDGVRIISVIPMIEEWLPGEGTPEDPWQYQAMGQPQMFDNILWSDRNMGADHYDATGNDYEKCVGYFYQAGRNIPYYPFRFEEYDINNGKIPDLKDKSKQDLANVSSAYNASKFRFFPIVDSRIRKMTGNWFWVMSSDQNPQMFIPETMPVDAFFDFSKGSAADSPGLTAEQDMHWEKDPNNQPVSGVWEIPSSRDFLSIFPSTPHAGNITFRTGGRNENPMGWGASDNAMNDTTKVLRVTVPYYYKNTESPMTQPAKNNASAMYYQAWNTLKTNNDPGCSQYGYANTWASPGPGNGGNPNFEPDGDPEDGFASVYVISREAGSLEAPTILSTGNWAIRSWGTIYAIKRIYTSGAYRMRWRVVNATKSAINPCFYVEICRYRCKPDAKLTQYNYMTYDWDHPAARLYIPICGLGDWTGEYINFGTECQYATSDPIVGGKTGAVQIKVTGNDPYNSYIAVVRGVINRTFGMQIRPVRINGGGK